MDEKSAAWFLIGYHVAKNEKPDPDAGMESEGEYRDNISTAFDTIEGRQFNSVPRDSMIAYAETIDAGFRVSCLPADPG